MLGKAMRFATVCALAFAICGRANRFERGSSKTTNVASTLPRINSREGLAAILALEAAVTPGESFASPHVRPVSAFAPFRENRLFDGTHSGPLHMDMIHEPEAIVHMVNLVEVDTVKLLQAAFSDRELLEAAAEEEDLKKKDKHGPIGRIFVAGPPNAIAHAVKFVEADRVKLEKAVKDLTAMEERLKDQAQVGPFMNWGLERNGKLVITKEFLAYLKAAYLFLKSGKVDAYLKANPDKVHAVVTLFPIIARIIDGTQIWRWI